MQTLAFLNPFDNPLHLLVILLGMLLIFGRRLPEVGRSLGQGIQEFKKGLKDAHKDLSDEPSQQPMQQNPYAQAPTQPPQAYMTPPANNPPQLQTPRQNVVGQAGAVQPGQARVSRNDMVD